MLFEDFLKFAKLTHKNHHNWRYGQSFFNALCEVRPDLAEQIRGTALDPFHKSSVLATTINFLTKNW